MTPEFKFPTIVFVKVLQRNKTNRRQTELMELVHVTGGTNLKTARKTSRLETQGRAAVQV